ncbi:MULTISPECIES: Smr/MutS family protein [Mesonia]|nr:Smr/MutS family protein [Mesonia oceanica]
MMKFKKGDKVEVLDDSIRGEVLKVESDKIIIKTEDEFEMIFNDDELVKVSAENEIKVKDDELMEALLVKTVKKRVVPQTSKKQKSIPPMEVDLHIHHLTDRAKQMSNFEMLNLQLDTARSQLEFAIKKRIQKIVFIHGVGEGVLKAELETLFSRYENVKFYDADFRQYGVGATEVYVFQNY